MPSETRIVAPGPRDRTVLLNDGVVLNVPEDWSLLPPGDAGLTRRVKAGGPSWTVQKKKGRRTFSVGVWAPTDRIDSKRAELEEERSTETYAKKRAADTKRREQKQAEYVGDFRDAVVTFLNFHSTHKEIGDRLADAVAVHATPVGSGTVARTQRIPIEKRAESAVIAWLRHQTTAYDNMKIARIKGERREVRRMLAQVSRGLLEGYRSGATVDPSCPLERALQADRLDASSNG
jgi:hypothetical protein